jgi:ABC-2 type transport system ATP-binding protein
MTAYAVEATPAIATAGLTKRFGRVQAVTNVSLEIPAGRVFGLLGPNGSGKTTLLSMLAGFIAPAAGEITLLGRSGPAGLRESRRSIGALIERPIFWPYLSCRNNLKCLQGLYHSPGGETELSRLLETAGLAGDAERRKFANCSTGMKARLGIAAALLGDPDVLILDEPTNGLDPVGIVEVRDLINSLCAGGQRTIVLASHLLNEVEQVCDSVGIMRRGQLLFSGPVSELRGPPLVTVRTTDDNRAATLLRDGGWDVRLPHGDGPGGGLEVTATPGREWEITRLLAGVGVYVSEMRSGSGSLEAGFMEVAGGDADQP